MFKQQHSATFVAGNSKMERGIELGYDVLDKKSSAKIAAAEGSPLEYEEAVIRAVQRKVGKSVLVVPGGMLFGLPSALRFSLESRAVLLKEIGRSLDQRLKVMGDAAIREKRTVDPDRAQTPQGASSEEAIEAARRDGLISDEDVSEVRAVLGIS